MDVPDKGPIYAWRSRVYWSDTDTARIAHFSSIFRFCEMAEEEFVINTIGPWKPGSVMFPRVHAECDFHKPLHVHDLFRVEIVGVFIGGKSITWRFRVYNESRGYESAECTIVTVAVDPETLQAVWVPDEVRRRLIEAGAVEKAG